MPSREAESAVEPEQRAADGATKHTGERDGDHEPSRRAGAHVRRKPLAQVVHDPWKKARFRNAEDEAEHVELDRCAHERHGDGDHAPREHDARDPPPRPHAREQQIARHLEQRVADEEDSGAGWGGWERQRQQFDCDNWAEHHDIRVCPTNQS